MKSRNYRIPDIVRIPLIRAPEGFSQKVMTKIHAEYSPSRGKKQGGEGWLISHLPLAMAAAVLLSFGVGLMSSFLLIPPQEPKTTIRVRFSLYSPGAREVNLAGDFNGWNADENRLALEGDGVWSIVLPLSPGRYRYMFLVDGKTWVSDPRAGHYINDGFGSKNAVLDIT